MKKESQIYVLSKQKAQADKPFLLTPLMLCTSWMLLAILVWIIHKPYKNLNPKSITVQSKRTDQCKDCPTGCAKCLAQDPTRERAKWEMLRAEQEQHGEGAAWPLLVVSPRHQVSSARCCTSSAAVMDHRMYLTCLRNPL